MNENPLPLSNSPIGAGERWRDIVVFLDRLALEAERAGSKALHAANKAPRNLPPTPRTGKKKREAR